MIKNIVFKGGGVLGIAYAGALKQLEAQGVIKNLVRVAGTSAGSMTAVLVALQYTADEIQAAISNVNFSSFEDGGIFSILEVGDKYGIHPGDTVERWAEQMISAKLGTKATFADLRARGFLDLYVIATNMNTADKQIFSFETTPHVIISEAVRASMSIPIFFDAFQFSTDPDHTLYVDGGVEWNFAMTIFDDVCGDLETLGLFLTPAGPSTYTKLKRGQPIKYAGRLFTCLMNAQDVSFFANPDLTRRTIQILHDPAIEATDFNLTKDQQTDLYNSGISSTKGFFQTLKYPYL